MDVLAQVKSLKERICLDIIGQKDVVDRLIIGLLANGNLLIEGLPGLAKTRAIKSLSKNLDGEFSRIQFTPDLLPSDITGSEVYYSDEGKGRFQFEQGPIFANIVLADEINRAPAKVQAALLEAMEERQVTVAGTTHKMPSLFIVMATQNPVEQEGTYPLPEAQVDRFLMHVTIEYGSKDDESKIISLVRGERKTRTNDVNDIHHDLIDQSVIFEARQAIDKIYVSESIQNYMVDLIYATREPEKYSDDLASWIDLGASPRGSLALDVCARAHAWLQGRDFVSPEDVHAIVKNVLRHRVSLSYEAQADGISSDAVIDEILKLVALP